LLSAPGFRKEKGGLYPRRQLISLLAALLFLAHPVQTEVVNYIVQRFTLLAVTFYVLSIGSYIKARIEEETSKKRTSAYWMWLGLSLGTLVLGIYTKEIVFTWPLMIVLVEIYGFGVERFRRRGLVFAVIGLLMLVLSFSLIWHYKGYILDIKTSSIGEKFAMKEYVLTQPRVVMKYVQLIFLPTRLVFDYYFPMSKSIAEPWVIVGLVFILGWLALAVWCYKKAKLVSFAIFWFFISLLVECTIIPIEDVIFEHRLYLPLAGVSLGIIATWFYWFKGKMVADLTKIAIVILVVFGLMVVNQNRVWRDEFSLWSDAVAKAPQKARAHLNYGLALQQKSRLDDAMNEYIKVGELEKSRIAVSHNNIGGIYFLKGNKDKALEYCLMATNEDDKYTDAFSNVAVIYATKDNPVEALKYIKKSLALDSENETAIGNYRSIMNKINEMNKAKAAPKTSILDRLGE
jgi:hypothetical protein